MHEHMFQVHLASEHRVFRQCLGGKKPISSSIQVRWFHLQMGAILKGRFHCVAVTVCPKRDDHHHHHHNHKNKNKNKRNTNQPRLAKKGEHLSEKVSPIPHVRHFSHPCPLGSISTNWHLSSQVDLQCSHCFNPFTIPTLSPLMP